MRWTATIFEIDSDVKDGSLVRLRLGCTLFSR